MPEPWEYEPNNQASEATGPLTSGQDYYGYLDDQWDYFSIYLSSKGQITIDLYSIDVAPDVVQLQLRNRDDAIVEYAAEPPYHIEWTGDPGQYYVAIYTVSDFNSDTPYTLQAVFASHTTPTPIPTPTLIPLELVAPTNGGTYRNPITLQWSGSLSAGQAYQATVYNPDSGHTVRSELLTAQVWTVYLPAEQYGEWRWTVSVVQSGGVMVTSAEQMFWLDPSGDARPTPAKPNTPTPAG